MRGGDYAVLKEKVAEMNKVLLFAASGMMTDIDTDFRDGVTEVHVEPDRDKAAASGVNVQDIADTINAAIGGVRQGKYTNGLRRYDVRLRLLPEQWQTTSDIDKLLVRTGYGELIPLSSVTHVTEEKGLLTITREMRQRAINIYANAATGQSLDKVMAFAHQTAKDILPDGYTLNEVGASEGSRRRIQEFCLHTGDGAAHFLHGAGRAVQQLHPSGAGDDRTPLLAHRGISFPAPDTQLAQSLQLHRHHCAGWASR